MVTVARQMRYKPWLLQDADLIRDRALPSHRRTLAPPVPPVMPADTCPARTPGPAATTRTQVHAQAG